MTSPTSSAKAQRFPVNIEFTELPADLELRYGGRAVVGFILMKATWVKDCKMCGSGHGKISAMYRSAANPIIRVAVFPVLFLFWQYVFGTDLPLLAPAICAVYSPQLMNHNQ